MSDGSDVSFEAPTGTLGLISQVQEFGFDSARLVVNRFAEMFERFQSGVAIAGGIPDFLLLGEGGPVGRITDAGQSTQLTLPDTEPGGRCSRRIWLHNPTPQAGPRLRVWAPALLTHDGHALDRSVIAFAPSRVTAIEAHSSLDILVTVSVPHDARAGKYHGHILVEGLPDTSFPVCVTVLEER